MCASVAYAPTARLCFCVGETTGYRDHLHGLQTYPSVVPRTEFQHVQCITIP